MVKLNTLIQNILKTNTDWRMQLMVSWPHIVGDLAQHVCIQKIDQNTVILGVYSAAWMQELHALSEPLRHRINSALDHPHVAKIRFRHANPTARYSAHAKTPAWQQPQPRPLTAKEEWALTCVRDGELRVQLHNFLQRCAQKEPRTPGLRTKNRLS